MTAPDAYLVGVAGGIAFGWLLALVLDEARAARARRRSRARRVGLDELDALDGIDRHPPAGDGARYACRAWGCTRCGNPGWAKARLASAAILRRPRAS